MRLFMCHDYGPNGRDIRWETTVAEEKAHNIHVGGMMPQSRAQRARRRRAQAPASRLSHPQAVRIESAVASSTAEAATLWARP